MLLKGVPGKATTDSIYISKQLKWLQSELNFTPDGPWWSQTADGKGLPFTLLMEGSK